MAHVIIIGGGLSGLSVAYRLRRNAPDCSVTVFERENRSGGMIGTEDHSGFRVEIGPNGFLDRTPFVPRLCTDLGLSGELVAGSESARKNRFLFLDKELREMPSGPFGLLKSSLLSWRGKWKLFTEPFRSTPTEHFDESISSFVTRRAGREAARIFADALVTGIHGGDPERLSVAAAFPRLPLMERQEGSLIRGFRRAARQRRQEARAQGLPPPGPQKMWSFKQGLGRLIDALVESLNTNLQHGVEVRTITESASVSSWKVHGFGKDTWSADAIVLACPAYEQAAMLADLNTQLAEEIASIRYNRIAVVALGYRRRDCPVRQDGFGYIAPQNTRRDVLGVQWCSSIFPDRAPPGYVLWRALCGGINRGEIVDWDDETIIRAVHEEMKIAMGVTAEPAFWRIIRWPSAIPQYEIGHLARLERIQALVARYPGLFLTGNAYRGVSMGDCAEQGELVASRVAEFLASTSAIDSGLASR